MGIDTPGASDAESGGHQPATGEGRSGRRRWPRLKQIAYLLKTGHVDEHLFWRGRRLFRFAVRHADRTPVRPSVPESRSVDRYLGCACWRSAGAAWNVIGGFDKEFFVYGEETDWRARAHATGRHILRAGRTRR